MRTRVRAILALLTLALCAAVCPAQATGPAGPSEPAREAAPAPVSTTTVEEQLEAARERMRARAWAIIDEAKRSLGMDLEIRSVQEEGGVERFVERFAKRAGPALEQIAASGVLTPESAREGLARIRTEMLDDFQDQVTARVKGVAPPPDRDDFDTEREYLAALLRYTVFEQNTLTDWLVLLSSIGLGVTLGWLGGLALRFGGTRVADKRRGKLAGCSLAAMAGPVNLTLVIAGVAIGLQAITMPSATRRAFDVALYVAWILPLFWIAWNLCDVVTGAIGRVTKRSESTLDDQLIPLLRKTLRIFVIILFALFVANNVLGANIAGFLAGFGIAGLAVSLAAQDSLKNLFGSITIFADKPFYLGDIVDFKGTVGTVEQVGFRSTRLRTFDGHLLTVPNSQLVNESVTSISARPAIRFRFRIGVTYDTPPEKLSEAMRILKEILAAAPGQRVDRPSQVVFEQFNAYSLDILCQWFYHPAEYWPAMEAASAVNEQILARFNEAGIDFAFPTRTLMLASDDARGLRLGRLREER